MTFHTWSQWANFLLSILILGTMNNRFPKYSWDLCIMLGCVKWVAMFIHDFVGYWNYSFKNNLRALRVHWLDQWLSARLECFSAKALEIWQSFTYSPHVDLSLQHIWYLLLLAYITVLHWKIRIYYFIWSKSYGSICGSCILIPFDPRPVLAFGYCGCLRLSVCASVCAVITSLSAWYIITCSKLESPNLDQRCKTTWLRSLLFYGTIDLDHQGQIELQSQN